MGLFGEEDEETAEEVDPPELEDEPGIDPSQEDGPEPSASADGEADGPDGEDLGQDDAQGEPSSEGDTNPRDDIDVEEALKDLSARMSVLSSNLEGVQESRGQLEDKIGDVEERMSRLGSLAEAVSSEYNPFVSENPPSDPSWKPNPEDPEAGADPASGPPLGPDDDGTSPLPEDAEPGEADPAPDPERPHPEPGDPSLDGEDASPGIPHTDPESLEPEPDESEPAQQPAAQQPPQGTNHRSQAPDELEENLLLLEWVGMMLDRVGRAGLLDLLDYYQNLGWLDPGTKDRATRVAIGVDAPDRVGDENWRSDIELHRRSLVAIQRLQGEQVPAARVDELELDLRRLFRE